MTYTMCDYPVSSDTAVFPITNIVGIVVAIIAVLMRLANRALDRRLGLDDYILIFTLVRETFVWVLRMLANRCSSLLLGSRALESSVCISYPQCIVYVC